MSKQNPNSGSPQIASTKPCSRRRDSTKHQAILQATRELLDEKGYRELTIKAIAGRAKVSRNVLYNWWGGRVNQIVEEALLPNVRAWTVPDHGNFKEDVEALLELTIEAIHRPNVLRGFLVLAAEIVNDRQELTETSRYFRAPYAELMGKIIKRAEQRGEITVGLNPKHMAQIISGTVMQFAISKNPGRRKAKEVLSSVLQTLAAKQ